VKADHRAGDRTDVDRPWHEVPRDSIFARVLMLRVPKTRGSALDPQAVLQVRELFILR
jgi:hypothetical protein